MGFYDESLRVFGAKSWFLDTLVTRSHNEISPHADVAELADAQVSEACDGDIVEVQVLSSAPKTYR